MLRALLFFIMFLLGQSAWAADSVFECRQLKGAYDRIMDDADEDTYANVLAGAYAENGFVLVLEDGKVVEQEELRVYFQHFGDEHGSYATTRLEVGKLLAKLGDYHCEFVQKALRWDPRLHEPPREEQAAK